jgi:UDP:flavonoid glycosyltransferase YjiC (YdhE family)
MEYFQKAVLDAGVEFECVGSREDFDHVIASPDIWKPFKGTRLVLAAALEAVPKVVSALRRVLARSAHERVVLLAPGTNMGARIMREATGTKLITIHLQPISLLSPHDFPVFHPTLRWLRRLPLSLRKGLMRLPNPIDVMVRGPLAAACQEAGVAPPRAFSKDWWHCPDGALVLFPAWFAAPQPDWSANHFQHTFPLEDIGKENPLSPSLQSFLSAGEAPILFTAGSGNQHARQFFRTAVAAVTQLGKRALLATRHAPDVPPDLPPSVRAEEYVPFGAVLPHCAAIVHHGGIGTLAQAIAGGVPQVITPLAHDQPDNAERVARLGLGDHAWSGAVSAEEMRRLLEGVLQSDAILRQVATARERLLADRETPRLIAWLEAQS